MASEDDSKNLRDPTDEELFKALEAQYPLVKGHDEVGRLVMPLKVDEFWELFH